MAASIVYNECLTLCIVRYILVSDVAVIESEMAINLFLEPLQSLLKYE